MSADAKLDRAIALARKLAQDPRAAGSTMTVACGWDGGKPTCLHGALDFHVDAGTPAAAWLEEVLPVPALGAQRMVYVSESSGCRMDWRRGEVEGVAVAVYVSAPVVKEAPCAPAA